MSGIAVFIDCDSTLTTIEGIDELAGRIGAGEKIAAITARAMAGELDLAAAFAQRMQVVRPDRADLAWLAGRYAECEVAGASAALRQLAADGCAVTVLSGGLAQAVRPFAEAMAVPGMQVHAVPVRLDAAGGYAGYDEDCPLVAADGKAVMCARLAPDARLKIMVGDGANDTAAVDAGALFVQFAGVCDRPLDAGRVSRRIEDQSLEGLPELVREMAA